MEPASLRRWYERLSARAVISMVGREQENRLLEFKTLSNDDLAREDRKNLATAISGFANADGGVVVWGAQARRDAKEFHIDQVVSADGLRNARLTLSRLLEYSATACSPPVIGVDHRLLVGRTSPSFIATFVPASDGGPHMAQLGEQRYYTRAGGSFVCMEHFQVADMFGRRARPVLVVSGYADAGNRGAFRIRVTNEGRGAAQALFLQLTVPPPFQRNLYGIDGNRNETLPLTWQGGNGWIHSGGMDFVLHPTMHVDVGGPWVGFSFERALPEFCEVTYKVGAIGIAPQTGVLLLRT